MIIHDRMKKCLCMNLIEQMLFYLVLSDFDAFRVKLCYEVSVSIFLKTGSVDGCWRSYC